jgi:threonine-phosphate decarboxylase
VKPHCETAAFDSVHQHGGDPAPLFTRLGIPPRPVVDFSVSINPLGPPSAVLQQWSHWCRDIADYPTVTGEPVKRFYQARWALAPETVLPGNGSVALIYLVLRVLGLRRLTVVSPSFHDYVRATHATNTEMTLLLLSLIDGFAPSAAARLARALELSDGLILGQPNNPTGTLFRRDVLLDLARCYPDRWLLIDEAFIQFVDDYQTKTLLTEERWPENLLVFHSLTKFYALPGLRLGAVVGHPKTIETLQHCEEPWPVNRVAEKAAEALLGAAPYEAQSQRWAKEERRRLTLRLDAVEGLRFFAPTANFVLAQWRATDDLDDLLGGLLKAGFHVRDCRNFPGLQQNFFRFALRDAAANDALLEAITQCVGSVRV